MAVDPVPKEYGSITPRLIVRNGSAAIAFYASAFGARERKRLATSAGRILHAEIVIGDSIVMVSEEMPERGVFGPKTLGGAGASIHLFVPDTDATMAQAAAAGARITMPAQDMVWGSRYGMLFDPFGHLWAIATHQRDVPNEEMAAAMNATLRTG